MFGFKKRRRRRLAEQPFPDKWQAILQKNVPYITSLPQELQDKLKGLTQIFLDEKTFEGCAGIEITPEIRVTIGAQACILLLGIEDLSSFYEELRSILVYPKSYVAKVKESHDSFFVKEGFQERQGEAWSQGYIVLAWDEVKQGAHDIHDGKNLVFHEFAHQLDYEYGATDLIEQHYDESHHLSWARIIGNEYRSFLKMLQQHQKTPIDKYGATNPAEFFAVITECFFEKSTELQNTHPELYQQLSEFYKQDPAGYIDSRNQTKDQ